MTADILYSENRGRRSPPPAEKNSAWTILDRNVSFRGGELDIVALDGDELVVAEDPHPQRGVDCSGGGVRRPPEARPYRPGGAAVRGQTGWQGPWRIDILAVTVGSDGSAALERFEDVTAGAYFS